jgi:NAD-dependent DNA ligase
MMRGGKVTDSVSGNTTAVIYQLGKDGTMKGQAKATAAEEKNIPLMSLEKFKKKYSF